MEEASQNTSSTGETLITSLSEKLKVVGGMSPNWCIYRVPKRIRQVNPDAYTPHLISIGPLHQKEQHLTDMEEHKWRYTISLLSRVETARPLEGPLRSCALSIIHSESEIRDLYAATIEISAEELAKVMLLDACFILELFFRYSEREQSEKVKNDPVFRSEWMLSAFRRDLALLENQMPFFVLERLFYMVVEHDENLRADSLPRMAFNFFFGSKVIPMNLTGGSSYKNNGYKHLLDLLLVYHLPWPPRNRLANKSKGDSTKIIIDDVSKNKTARGVVVPSAKSFIESGGSIKKVEIDTENLFDIKFAKGELQVPRLHIHDWTDSFFRNLIAYEHCSQDNVNSETCQYMVSYVVLMDRLIKTQEDLELLESKGIITVELGGSEDVTNFFKDICKQVIVKDFYFQDLCEELEKFSKSKMRKYFRDLKKTKLKNPWTILSLSGAIILLVLSALQTAYTIKR